MDFLFLQNTQLFHGIREDEIKVLLSCLNYRQQKYRKDEIIFRAGDVVSEIGLVKEGSVNIVVNFYWGNSNIFSNVRKGSIFAENFAAIPGKELICDVVAAEDSEIFFMNLKNLMTTCRENCSFHHRLIYNLMRIAAEKNLELSSRMMHIAPKSIRERLLSYLSEQASKHVSHHFRIPFNRQQLADYLGVDRSAMSNELSKMRKDGLIQYHKNEFTLCEARFDETDEL